MDIQHIKELIDLMEERSLAQLEVEADNEKVAITRHLPQAASTVVSAPIATPVAAPAAKPAPNSKTSRIVRFIVFSFNRHHGKRQTAKEKGDTHQNASHHVALAFGIGQIVQKQESAFQSFHRSTSLRKNRQTRDEADSGHGSKQVRQSLNESGHSVSLQNISLRFCR